MQNFLCENRKGGEIIMIFIFLLPESSVSFTKMMKKTTFCRKIDRIESFPCKINICTRPFHSNTFTRAKEIMQNDGRLCRLFYCVLSCSYMLVVWEPISIREDILKVMLHLKKFFLLFAHFLFFFFYFFYERESFMQHWNIKIWQNSDTYN